MNRESEKQRPAADLTVADGAHADQAETVSVGTSEHGEPVELPRVSPPEVLALLGTGGTATVHLAQDHAIHREVALKRIRVDKPSSPRRRAEFVHEARIMGQLQHPGIVPVFQLAADESDTPYFTMEVIDGVPLRLWLADPERPVGSRARLTEGIEVLLRVADAVAYAHSRGVIHRDIKPDNIMVGHHGRVYLVDWGLALDCEGRREKSAEARSGTPGYLAPEQARGEAVDELADVFGLGAVLFKIVTGTVPYRATEGAKAIEEAGLGQVMPTRSAAPPGTPLGLLAVCDRALAPDRFARYRSVEDFQADLRKVLLEGVLLPQRRYLAGAAIVRQGEVGEEAFLVVDGICRVTQGWGPGEHVLRTMGKGELFGELALLLDEPRSANVLAETDVVVLVMDRAALEDSGALHGFPSVLLKSLARRFRELENSTRGRR